MGKSAIFKSIIPILILLVLIGGTGFFLANYIFTSRTLPVYNPIDINPDLVDDAVATISENHKIAAFSVINQNGETITEADYQNKIYVANFFFTRCKTICLPMMDNMRGLQDDYENDSLVQFLSFSVTPKIDSIPVLQAYAKKRGILQRKWNITTGNKKHIYELARKSYFAVLDEGDGDLQDFIHTERFILIDKKKQIRGFYDGTDPQEMLRLKKDITLLKQKS
jgi:protein SCO1/2